MKNLSRLLAGFLSLFLCTGAFAQELPALFAAFTGDDTPDALTWQEDAPHTRLGEERLPFIAAGYDFFLAADTEGKVWGWGNNSSGQMGIKASKKITVPTQAAVGLPDIPLKKIACGRSSSLFLLEDGSLWTAGGNNKGQQGMDTKGKKNEAPVMISGLPPIVDMDCGSTHCLALDAEGCVWTWGSGDKGQLGHGGTKSSAVPRRIEGLTDICQVVCGSAFSLALTRNGALYGWGDNAHGQLTDAVKKKKQLTPALLHTEPLQTVAAGSAFCCGLAQSGQVYCWGSNEWFQLGVKTFRTDTPEPVAVKLPKGFTAKKLTAGGTTVLAVSAGGTGVLWGNALYGQLGNGSFPSKKPPDELLVIHEIRQAALTNQAAALLLQDGRVLTAGAAKAGETGLKDYHHEKLIKWSDIGHRMKPVTQAQEDGEP